MCGSTPKDGYDLRKKYPAQGLERYLQLDWKPRSLKLSAARQRQLLKRAASENGFGSQPEARRYVRDEFGVGYRQGGICWLFQRLKITAKEPRPPKINASAEEQAASKKTLPGESPASRFIFRTKGVSERAPS